MSLSSFFHTYKELFEYEKHVGSDDPVLLSQRDGIGAKTFLDKYRECEQRQVIESRAALQVPLMSTLTVDSVRARGAPLGTPTITPFVISSSLLAQQQYQQHQPETSHQVIPPLKVSPSSSFTRSKLENSLRQSLSNQEDAAVAASSWVASFNHHQYSAQVPEKQASPSKADVVPSMPSPSLPVDASKTLAHTLHAAAERSSLHFQPPKLAELLIDNSTRPATLRHRHLDEAKKIELLVGNSCGGRISSVSTNLPPSIRRRLQASMRVEQRREQLYAVLRQEYHKLCPHHQ